MNETTAITEPKPRQRKGTRDKLLRAALSLLAEDKGGFAGLSLREITRRIGVSPTAFYRHFPGMEELGLTLVHESCETLREQLDRANAESGPEDMVHNTVQVFLDFVREHKKIFILIAREQVGGSKKMRAAISKEVEVTSAQLMQAWVLRDMPGIPGKSQERLVRMSIALAIGTLPQILEMPADSEQEMKALADELEQQLNLLISGVAALDGFQPA
jgi:AcrR family transcriptional regulator